MADVIFDTTAQHAKATADSKSRRLRRSAKTGELDGPARYDAWRSANSSAIRADDHELYARLEGRAAQLSGLCHHMQGSSGESLRALHEDVQENLHWLVGDLASEIRALTGQIQVSMRLEMRAAHLGAICEHLWGSSGESLRKLPVDMQENLHRLVADLAGEVHALSAQSHPQ